MKTVAKIIELHGGLKALARDHLKIELGPGMMPLVIEHIGPGPGGNPCLSVAHYYLQNGDSMQDPEMTFTVNPAEDALAVASGVSWKCGAWQPVMYQTANPPVYQEAIQEQGGKVMYSARLLGQLRAFARQWDRNLAAQGYLDAFKRSRGIA
jgi:hypothetical protein